MTTPAYSGVTSDGAALTLVAEAARPGSGNQAATADSVEANLVTPDGATTRFRAATAALDTGKRRLTMGGGVEIVTAQGFTITTDALTAALDRTSVESSGALQASGPLGQLEAGSMTLTQTAEAGPYVLLFQSGVKLIYLPRKPD